MFSLSVTALAAETYTITVDGSGTVANHTFEAYQIFSGDLHTPETGEGGNTSKILSNIVWGTGVNTAAAGFDAAFPDSAAVTAERLITVADARAFAKIAPFLSGVTRLQHEGRFRQLCDLQSAGRLLPRQGQG